MLLPALAVAAGASVLDVPTPAQPPAPLGEVVPAEVPAVPAPSDPGTVVVAAPPITPGDGTVVEAPAPPPAELPGVEVVPVTGGSALRSVTPETPPASTTPLPITSDLPLAPPPAIASRPTPERVATTIALAEPVVVVSVAPTVPDQPVGTTVARVAKSDPAVAVAKAPRHPENLAELVPNLLAPPRAAESAPREFAGSVSAPEGSRSAIRPTRSSESTIFDTNLVPHAGSPPAGSSLLAVLAGYALPGGGGAPASTLVLFIVVGLIIGLGYAACSQGTERIALGRLLGAASGHRLAVCRPG